MALEMEAPPDRAGFVQLALGAALNFVQFAYYELAPHVALLKEAGDEAMEYQQSTGNRD